MPSIKAKTVPITVKNPLTPQAHDPTADERRIARRSPRGKRMPSTNQSRATSNNELTISQQVPSEHHGVGIDWLSQEQKEPLQQCNFDHDEAKAQRGEVADPGPPPFDPKPPAL